MRPEGKDGKPNLSEKTLALLEATVEAPVAPLGGGGKRKDGKGCLYVVEKVSKMGVC